MTVNTQELRRLHGAATAGEWLVRDDVTPWANWICGEGGDADICEVGEGWTPRDMPEAEANAAAIVALHNAAPLLLDAADRLARIEAVMADVAQVMDRLIGAAEAVAHIENTGVMDDAITEATAALAALRELIATR